MLHIHLPFNYVAKMRLVYECLFVVDVSMTIINSKPVQQI